MKKLVYFFLLACFTSASCDQTNEPEYISDFSLLKIGSDGKTSIYPFDISTYSNYYSLDSFSEEELILLNPHNGYHAWIFNTRTLTFEKQTLPNAVATTFESNDYVGAGLFVQEHSDTDGFIISYSLIGKTNGQWKTIQTFSVSDAPLGRKNVFTDFELVSRSPLQVSTTTLTYTIVTKKNSSTSILNPFYAFSDIYERKDNSIFEKIETSIPLTPPTKSFDFKIWSSTHPSIFLVRDGTDAFYSHNVHTREQIPITSFDFRKSYNWIVNESFLVTNVIDYGATTLETMSIKAYDILSDNEITFNNSITYSPFSLGWVGFYSREPQKIELLFRNTTEKDKLKTFTFDLDTKNVIESDIDSPFLLRGISDMIAHGGDAYGIAY